MAEWKEPKNDYVKEDQVVPEIFNTLAENERYLQEKKITTEQVQDAMVSSTQASSRTNLSASESVKGAFGKIRKWFADLKSLAFKSTIAQNDIDAQAVSMGKIASNAVSTGKLAAQAVTTAKLADGAVTDEKVSSVSASKITGLAALATSGSYNDLVDVPASGAGFAPTFVVDSNEKLAQWVNNDTSCDFSIVLIKKGTWSSSLIIQFNTYDGRKKNKCGVNLSRTKTKIIIGEEGSKLYFSVDENSVYDIPGLGYEYGDSRKETDKGYFICGVTVQCYGANAFTDQSASCFSGCCNLIDCSAICDNGYDGFGFSGCYNVTNCTAEVTAQNYAAAFSGGKNYNRCVGHASVWQADRKWLGGCAVGFRNCENLLYCKGSATCTPATTDYTAYGFSACKAVSRCKQNRHSSTGTFINSYYSNESNDTYVCANTANGGFNDTSNA